MPETNGSTETTTALARQSSGELIRVGFDTERGFEALQRVAKMFAASNLVPEQYRNSIANCAIAVELAARIGASPLMAMQNLYIVHGRPGWSSQFLISAFNQCGRFSALRYRFTGEKGKDTWGCIAYATELSSGEKLESTEITISMAKAEGWHGKNGSKWQSMPEQMLRYRAASFLIRSTAPELTMGLQAADEIEDVGPAVFAAPPPNGPVVEALPRSPAAAPEVVASTLADAQAALREAAGEEVAP